MLCSPIPLGDALCDGCRICRESTSGPVERLLLTLRIGAMAAVGNAASAAPGEGGAMGQRALPNDILARAGRLAAPRAMVWIRGIDAPAADVWRLVSTLDGLAKWWIVLPSVLELRPGGTFRHRWENTVHDLREGEFIDFREPNGSYAGTGGMRLELRPEGGGTAFAFLDTWAEGIEAAARATWRTSRAAPARRGDGHGGAARLRGDLRLLRRLAARPLPLARRRAAQGLVFYSIAW